VDQLKIPLPKRSSTEHNSPKHLKRCNFPGCEVEFIGINRQRYCEEHQKKEYHKQLYRDKYKIQADGVEDTSNKIICHDYKVATTEIHVCECCKKEYPLLIQKNTHIYPKYCPQHRNEQKRKNYWISSSSESSSSLSKSNEVAFSIN